MTRLAFICALGAVASYGQAPATPPPSPSQTGQAHIATPNQKPGNSTTYKRDDDANRKKKKTEAPNNPGVKTPIRNPANGPVGTPTNPK